jgi:CheY-like chemotaxis protein
MSMREALSKLSIAPIGLIICDVFLRDVTALQFLTFFKKKPLKESIPFIFYISLENQKYLKPFQAIQLNARDYMVYPMDENDFVSRISEIIPLESSGNVVDKQLEKEYQTGLLERQPLKEAIESEAPTDKIFDFLSPIKILISKDSLNWSHSQLVNFDRTQGLIEASFPSQIGKIIKVKCWLPDGEAICSGEVIHVISGDKEKQAGFLINFKEDREWNRIFEYFKTNDIPMTDSQKTAMKSDSLQSQISLSSPDTKTVQDALSENAIRNESEVKSPISIKVQVSRDGMFWIPGHIMNYGNKNTMLATSILAKPGDAIKIKYSLPKGSITAIGKVEKLSLYNLQKPAAMQIVFTEDSEWRRIFEYLGPINQPAPLENKDSLLSKTRIKPPLSQISSEPSVPGEPNEKTMVDTLAQKERFVKNQFYQSLIGKQLDNYIVNSFINSGGMGGIFKGWDTVLERDVALKVISYDLSSQKKFVDMFFKEARFASKLNHPNIAQIYHIGKANDILYFVMEFVYGQTWRELIKNSVPLSLKKKVKYLLTVCMALDFVWQKRIIHRDIKPENIMVNNNGVTKIVDFGVAKQFKNGKSSRRQKIIGSPRYLSPEAILGNPVDQRSDIYSLGATCYYLLTNNPPFSGYSIDVILHKHVNEKPVPSYKINPEIPIPLSDIIEKMLAKNPDDRYQDYKTIIREVEEKHAHLWKN